MARRPDFSEATKRKLAKRAGDMCSRPGCTQRTGGPHTDPNRAINIGEAAHIRGARPETPRYKPEMTDEERADISNGIWLCRTCAKLVDSDEMKYTVELLQRWKEDHERAFVASEPSDPAAAREIRVKDGGIGSIVEHTGEGTALEIVHLGQGPAERISVQGRGIGEVISSSGPGTAKRIVSIEGGPASEVQVNVTEPVQQAAAMVSKLVITTCGACGRTVHFCKVVQAFAGDADPKVNVKCPHCGAVASI